MSKYWELLKDPRWQRKRLEILDRDGFACRTCNATERTLHVHHMYYEKGLKPWEYPDESLRTLCEECHVSAGVIQQDLLRELGRLELYQFHEVLGYVKALAAVSYDLATDEMRYEDFRLDDIEESAGVMKYFCVYWRQEQDFFEFVAGPSGQKTFRADVQKLQKAFDEQVMDRSKRT